APNVVGLASRSLRQHRPNRLTMVCYVEPVADVLTVTINRQWLALTGIQDHQRNQLFWKLKRAVIVGTISCQRRQSISVVVGAHEMIRSRFGCGVWAVRTIGRRFRKRRIIRP